MKTEFLLNFFLENNAFFQHYRLYLKYHIFYYSERKYAVIDLTPSGILGRFVALPTRRFLTKTLSKLFIFYLAHF